MTKMHACCQSMYYMYCNQFTTRFIIKNYKNNKLHNQHDSHKMELMENIF